MSTHDYNDTSADIARIANSLEAIEELLREGNRQRGDELGELRDAQRVSARKQDAIRAMMIRRRNEW